MNEEKPLLSDFLEELKVYKEGAFLDKTISIFYNDWSLNPYDDDDYSERVQIKGDVLKNINSKEFKNYEVLWYDQCVFNPDFIEICVNVKKNKMKTLEFTDSELEEFKHLLKWAISNSWDNYYASLDEEDKEGFKRLATKYEKLFNKFFERSPKSQKH